MGSQKTRAVIAIAAANFLVMLAVVPVAGVIPMVASQFGVDITTAGWVMTAFLLTLTACLLIAGRIGDLYGHREVFLAGAILYTVAGTLCGLTQQIGILIALRALQGIGAAMISGNSLAIVAHSFTPRDRGRAIGIAAASAALGSVVGVLGSSYLTQYLTWQAFFYLTLPVGLISIAAAWRLESVARRNERPQLDIWGALLLAATLVGVSLAISHSHSGEAGFLAGWRYHGALLTATVVVLILFVHAERHAAQPILDLHYMRNGRFVWAVVANEMMHMTMMSSTFLIPFLTVSGRGFTLWQSAAVLLATLLGNVPTPPLSGWLFDRTHWRLLAPVSLGFVALSLAGMSVFAATASFLGLFALALALGVGSGFFQTPNNTLIMGTVPPELRGFAAGMIETSRQLGHTLAVGISGTVMAAALAGATQVESATYVAGYQQAMMVASIWAIIGVAAALIQARRPNAKETSVLAKQA